LERYYSIQIKRGVNLRKHVKEKENQIPHEDSLTQNRLVTDDFLLTASTVHSINARLPGHRNGYK
jgi:hypothetical protein